MPTITRDDPVMAARYGLDRGRSPVPWFVGAVVVVYLGVAVWAALSLSRTSLEGNVLGWRAGERSVALTLEVRGSTPGAVDCVLRATDATATDVGYRTVTVAHSPVTTQVTLPTVIRASSVGVLACGPAGEELRVPPPDFPPGVAIP